MFPIEPENTLQAILHDHINDLNRLIADGQQFQQGNKKTWIALEEKNNKSIFEKAVLTVVQFLNEIDQNQKTVRTCDKYISDLTNHYLGMHVLDYVVGRFYNSSLTSINHKTALIYKFYSIIASHKIIISPNQYHSLLGLGDENYVDNYSQIESELGNEVIDRGIYNEENYNNLLESNFNTELSNLIKDVRYDKVFNKVLTKAALQIFTRMQQQSKNKEIDSLANVGSSVIFREQNNKLYCDVLQYFNYNRDDKNYTGATITQQWELSFQNNRVLRKLNRMVITPLLPEIANIVNEYNQYTEVLESIEQCRTSDNRAIMGGAKNSRNQTIYKFFSLMDIVSDDAIDFDVAFRGLNGSIQQGMYENILGVVTEQKKRQTLRRLLDESVQNNYSSHSETINIVEVKKINYDGIGSNMFLEFHKDMDAQNKKKLLKAYKGSKKYVEVSFEHVRNLLTEKQINQILSKSDKLEKLDLSSIKQHELSINVLKNISNISRQLDVLNLKNNKLIGLRKNNKDNNSDENEQVFRRLSSINLLGVIGVSNLIKFDFPVTESVYFDQPLAEVDGLFNKSMQKAIFYYCGTDEKELIATMSRYNFNSLEQVLQYLKICNQVGGNNRLFEKYITPISNYLGRLNKYGAINIDFNRTEKTVDKISFWDDLKNLCQILEVFRENPQVKRRNLTKDIYNASNNREKEVKRNDYWLCLENKRSYSIKKSGSESKRRISDIIREVNILAIIELKIYNNRANAEMMLNYLLMIGSDDAMTLNNKAVIMVLSQKSGLAIEQFIHAEKQNINHALIVNNRRIAQVGTKLSEKNQEDLYNNDLFEMGFCHDEEYKRHDLECPYGIMTPNDKNNNENNKIKNNKPANQGASLEKNKKAQQPASKNEAKDKRTSNHEVNIKREQTLVPVCKVVQADDCKAGSNESVHRVVSANNIQGLKYQSVPGDGHCLFHAIGLYLGEDAKFLRLIVAANMEINRDDYRQLRSGTDEEFDRYINDIREGREWGDHIEIEIIERLMARPVIILRPNDNPIIPHNIAEYAPEVEPIFLHYNGIHYDALLIEDGFTGNWVLMGIQERLALGESVHYIADSCVTEFSEHSLLNQLDKNKDHDEQNVPKQCDELKYDQNANDVMNDRPSNAPKDISAENKLGVSMNEQLGDYKFIVLGEERDEAIDLLLNNSGNKEIRSIVSYQIYKEVLDGQYKFINYEHSEMQNLVANYHDAKEKFITEFGAFQRDVLSDDQYKKVANNVDGLFKLMKDDKMLEPYYDHFNELRENFKAVGVTIQEKCCEVEVYKAFVSGYYSKYQRRFFGVISNVSSKKPRGLLDAVIKLKDLPGVCIYKDNDSADGLVMIHQYGRPPIVSRFKYTKIEESYSRLMRIDNIADKNVKKSIKNNMLCKAAVCNNFSKTCLDKKDVRKVNFNGKKISFVKMSVRGDGNCGFSAIGVDRNTVISFLLDHYQEKKYREAISKDILAEIITSNVDSGDDLGNYPGHNAFAGLDFSSFFKLESQYDELKREYDDMVNEVKKLVIKNRPDTYTLIMKMSNDAFERKLENMSLYRNSYNRLIQFKKNKIEPISKRYHDYIEDEKLYKLFLNSFLDKGLRRWMTCIHNDDRYTPVGLIDAIVMMQKIPGLCVWAEDSKTRELNLFHQYGDTERAQHILYRAEFNHFDILSVVENLEDIKENFKNNDLLLGALPNGHELMFGLTDSTVMKNKTKDWFDAFDLTNEKFVLKLLEYKNDQVVRQFVANEIRAAINGSYLPEVLKLNPHINMLVRNRRASSVACSQIIRQVNNELNLDKKSIDELINYIESEINRLINIQVNEDENDTNSIENISAQINKLGEHANNLHKVRAKLLNGERYFIMMSTELPVYRAYIDYCIDDGRTLFNEYLFKNGPVSNSLDAIGKMFGIQFYLWRSMTEGNDLELEHHNFGQYQSNAVIHLLHLPNNDIQKMNIHEFHEHESHKNNVNYNDFMSSNEVAKTYTVSNVNKRINQIFKKNNDTVCTDVIDLMGDNYQLLSQELDKIRKIRSHYDNMGDSKTIGAINSFILLCRLYGQVYTALFIVYKDHTPSIYYFNPSSSKNDINIEYAVYQSFPETKLQNISYWDGPHYHSTFSACLILYVSQSFFKVNSKREISCLLPEINDFIIDRQLENDKQMICGWKSKKNETFRMFPNFQLPAGLCLTDPSQHKQSMFQIIQVNESPVSSKFWQTRAIEYISNNKQIYIDDIYRISWMKISVSDTPAFVSDFVQKIMRSDYDCLATENPEIQAYSKFLERPIVVIYPNNRFFISAGDDFENNEPLFLLSDGSFEFRQLSLKEGFSSFDVCSRLDPERFEEPEDKQSYRLCNR